MPEKLRQFLQSLTATEIVEFWDWFEETPDAVDLMKKVLLHEEETP